MTHNKSVRVFTSVIMLFMLICQDYIVHECAPKFLVQLFKTYLGKWYEVLSIKHPVT